MSSAMAPMWHMIHIRLFQPFFHLLTLAHRSPRAMWPHHLHPVAAALCIFQPNQQTIISNSIFYLSSPKTVGLMSWALLATPRLHCAAGNLQLSSVCVCVLYVCLSHVLQPQHQYAAARTVCPCNPLSSLHLHLSQRPLSLYLSLLHSSAGTVTPSPGGQLNGCFARQMDVWVQGLSDKGRRGERMLMKFSQDNVGTTSKARWHW